MLEQERKDVEKMKTGNLKKSELRVKKTTQKRMGGNRMEQQTGQS
jgi:hypothetical protein